MKTFLNNYFSVWWYVLVLPFTFFVFYVPLTFTDFNMLHRLLFWMIYGTAIPILPAIIIQLRRENYAYGGMLIFILIGLVQITAFCSLSGPS